MEANEGGGEECEGRVRGKSVREECEGGGLDG